MVKVINPTEFEVMKIRLHNFIEISTWQVKNWLKKMT